MKRVITHPEEPKTGKRYWRSLSEMARTPEFQAKLDREFLDGQAEMKDESDAETSRRGFLKLMGASTALMGLAACRRPEAFIKPYAKAPEWVIPGNALYYATAMPRQGGATPMVVTSYEGRPTHLAGNSLHPESNGGLDVQAQASVLGLYDPERSRKFLKGGKESTKADFLKALAEKKAAVGAGKGWGLLLDEVNSPTRNRLVADLQKKLPELKVYKYEPLAPSGAVAANAEAFGPGVVLNYHFDKADRVLSLDADFMGIDRVGNNSTSHFMKGRKAEKPEDSMNRLYVAEANYSVTGGMADHRLRLAPSQIFKAAAHIAKALGLAAPAVDSDLGHPDAPKWLELAAKDLQASKGKVIVIAGNQQPKEVHLLAAAINNALGAFGSTITLSQGEAPAPVASIQDLAKALESKQVNTLIAITEANPAYDAPAELKFAEKLSGAELILVSTRVKTATARAAAWVVPGTHYLEQWGDVRSTDGTYSIVQPMILPLHGGLSDLDVLSELLADPKPADAAPAAPAMPGAPEDPGPSFKAVKATFDSICKAENKEDAWGFALRDGFLPDSAFPAGGAYNAASLAAAANFKPTPAPKEGALEVVLAACGKIYDGRYINNGWLQEAPDAVSKVTWDNAALVSLKTAKNLGVQREHYSVDQEAAIIEVKVADQTLKLPVVVVPGHAENVITVALGYGQGTDGDQSPGQVAAGSGVNVYPLRTSEKPYFIGGASAKTNGETYPIALTQEHSAMYGRALVREGKIEDWKDKPDFVLEMGSDAHVHGSRKEKNDKHQYTFYKPEGNYRGEDRKHLFDDLHQWSMVIDLNRCIGCSSCLVACQSENNIPIVGKDQVIRGREMHWIRMDRYFATDLDTEVLPENITAAGKLFGQKTDVWDEDFTDEPEMVVQPVACQHCESAPCETVCPVNATVHSPDGLNLMAYNRCIGTRYCANNCPFKARRFNFFDYNKRNPLTKTVTMGIEHNNLYSGVVGERHDTELSKLQKNPNVTVRMRGVMEKCTYCIQRIEASRIDARAKGRKNAALEAGKFDETLVIDKEALRIKKDVVKTACQIACPADAIMFGNISEGSKDTVNTWRANSRNYEILNYLALKARTTYLGRIKNPNPEMFAIKWEKDKAGNASKLHPVGGHAVAHPPAAGAGAAH